MNRGVRRGWRRVIAVTGGLTECRDAGAATARGMTPPGKFYSSVAHLLQMRAAILAVV